MHTRDALGRQVSLLNDESGTREHALYDMPPQRPTFGAASQVISQPFHPYGRSPSPYPPTPELLQSDSYDSHGSNDPLTPASPVYDYGRVYIASGEARSPYDDFLGDPHAGYAAAMKRPSLLNDSRSSSYEDDSAPSPSSGGNDRPGKRYPCRFKESHGCEKTFTTSGHASRHSKIHTAEKAVPCTFPGCSKKFTRADNMKQHLETHYKDKARSSGSRAVLSATERKASAGRSASRTKTPAAMARRDLSPMQMPRPWDVRGLDALAMAVACQEGA